MCGGEIVGVFIVVMMLKFFLWRSVVNLCRDFGDYWKV